MGAARGERASPQVALATLLVALLALGAASRAAHLSAAATAVAAGALLCAATGWAALVAAHPRGDGAQCAAELNGAGGGAHKPVGGSSGGKDKQAPHERKGDTWRGGTKVCGGHTCSLALWCRALRHSGAGECRAGCNHAGLVF